MEIFKVIRDQQIGRALGSVLLVFAVVLVFYNSLQNEFVYDDHFVVVQNAKVKTIDPLDLLTTEYWSGFKQEGLGTYYRPLTILTFALDYAIWGPNPLGFHITNLLIHTAATVLFFLFLTRLSVPRPAAFVAALLFAIHPVHTEAVANISGRSDLLLAVFALLLLLFHSAGGRRCVLGSACSLFLALLCKESALVLPAVLIFYDVIFLRQKSQSLTFFLKARVRFYHLWLWASVGIYMILRTIAVGNLLPVSPSPLDNPLVDASFFHRLLTLPVLVLHYARLLVFPVTLSVDYSFNQIPVVSSLWDGAFALGLCVTLLLGWAIRRSWQKSPLGTFAVGLILIPLSLNLNTLLPSGTLLAERYLYLPSVGFCLMFGLAYFFFLERVRKPGHLALVIGAATLLLSASGVRTFLRNQDWKTDETLFKSATIATPNSVRGHLNVAFLLRKKGDMQGALRHYHRILAIKPDYPIVNYNLAETYKGLRDQEAALFYYEQAARHKPGFVEAWTSLGKMYLDMGKELEAESAFIVALNLSPDLAFVHNQIGVIKQRKGDHTAARESYQKAIDGNYRSPGVFCNLGVAYANEGKRDEARQAYLQALSLRPDLAIAHYHLGNLYREQGNKVSALDHYRAFLRYWKSDPRYLDIVKQSILALDLST